MNIPASERKSSEQILSEAREEVIALYAERAKALGMKSLCDSEIERVFGGVIPTLLVIPKVKKMRDNGMTVGELVNYEPLSFTLNKYLDQAVEEIDKSQLTLF